jgi:predicted XRE-type DNA-binding protein
MKRDEFEHEVGSGNVFADLGLPDSAELMAKAELVRQIAAIIARRHLTQAAAARVLGTTQPKVSDLLRGRLAGFSVERIIRFLNALDRDVQLIVTPKKLRTGHGRFWVVDRPVPNAPMARARRPRHLSLRRGGRTNG